MDGEAREGSDRLAPLARAAAAGDRDAQRRLLGEVGPAMSAAIRTMTRASDVDDATQEAMVGFLRALPAFRYESSVKHFACRVAVRTASVVNRTRTRRGRADDLGRDAEALRPSDPSPHELATSGERARLLRDLIATLPAEQAEVLALRVVLGCSLEEVAEATGAPANTVRSRLRLAKEALRKRIEEDPRARELTGDEP